MNHFLRGKGNPSGNHEEKEKDAKDIGVVYIDACTSSNKT